MSTLHLLGPFEHQAIHHVKGAELKHDKCKMAATVGGVLRLNKSDPSKPIHVLQRFYISQQLLLAVLETIFGSLYVVFKLQQVKIFSKNREWVRVGCSVLGVIWELCVCYCVLVLPLTRNILAFVLLLLIKRKFGIYSMFWAQHDWESNISEELADTDWLKYNAITSRSVQGEAMMWHPTLWGYPKGACPSTLTYHLEHTLFPAVNYMYLPRIASICETTLQEYGIPYHKFNGYLDLEEKVSAQLSNFSFENRKI
jgi:fatty acid desaturase